MSKRPQAPSKTLVRDARAALSDCAGWASRLAARRITNFLEERIQDSGLRLAQMGLMAQIVAAPDDTLGALAERTGLDQSTLSRNLRADFKTAFGEEPGKLIAYGVMSDTDNTGASIEAWYGDIVFATE